MTLFKTNIKLTAMAHRDLTPADLVHRGIQNKLAILRDEKENMGELHPFLSYQHMILEALDANYDDLADMENMKLALLELLKIFEPIKL